MKTKRRKRQTEIEDGPANGPDHDLLFRPADAGRGAGAAGGLLGNQKRVGARADPPLPPAPAAPAAAGTVADGPVHPRPLTTTRPAPSPPSAGCTTATSTCKHRLASANIRLAAHVAKRFRHHALSYADLLQEAVCGLMQAIDRFDVSHGTRLATYATWWIRQTLQIAVARQSHLVSLSPHHLQELGLLQQESEALAHGGKHLPSPQELASPHRQQPGAPDPPPDRHAHAGLAQRRPRRRQRLQAHRGDAGQRELARCGRTPNGRKRCTS